jgi:hypothetical protein
MPSEGGTKIPDSHTGKFGPGNLVPCRQMGTKFPDRLTGKTRLRDFGSVPHLRYFWELTGVCRTEDL